MAPFVGAGADLVLIYERLKDVMEGRRDTAVLKTHSITLPA